MHDRALKDSFSDVDLDELRQGFAGQEYRQLIQEHMRKLGNRLELSMQASIQAMLEAEKEVAELMIDEINLEAHDAAFWRNDCAQTFDRIAARYSVYMDARDQSPEPADIFNVFQLITMNLAATARDNKALRVHAGIRKGLLFR